MSSSIVFAAGFLTGLLMAGLVFLFFRQRNKQRLIKEPKEIPIPKNSGQPSREDVLAAICKAPSNMHKPKR
jgi:uncharacterized membrane protein YciS (DUF1049 family)